MVSRCLLPWDCLSSCNLCPVIENDYEQSEEYQIVTQRIFFYVRVHSLYTLGSLAGTKGDLGWAGFALQGCGPAEMLKCFPSSHLPQLEPQGLPPPEQGWYPLDAHFYPSCTDPGLKPTPALERGPQQYCKDRRLINPIPKAEVAQSCNLGSW